MDGRFEVRCLGASNALDHSLSAEPSAALALVYDSRPFLLVGCGGGVVRSCVKLLGCLPPAVYIPSLRLSAMADLQAYIQHEAAHMRPVKVYAPGNILDRAISLLDEEIVEDVRRFVEFLQVEAAVATSVTDDFYFMVQPVFTEAIAPPHGSREITSGVTAAWNAVLFDSKQRPRLGLIEGPINHEDLGNEFNVFLRQVPCSVVSMWRWFDMRAVAWCVSSASRVHVVNYPSSRPPQLDSPNVALETGNLFVVPVSISDGLSGRLSFHEYRLLTDYVPNNRDAATGTTMAAKRDVEVQPSKPPSLAASTSEFPTGEDHGTQAEPITATTAVGPSEPPSKRVSRRESRNPTPEISPRGRRRGSTPTNRSTPVGSPNRPPSRSASGIDESMLPPAEAGRRPSRRLSKTPTDSRGPTPLQSGVAKQVKEDSPRISSPEGEAFEEPVNTQPTAAQEADFGSPSDPRWLREGSRQTPSQRSESRRKSSVYQANSREPSADVRLPPGVLSREQSPHFGKTESPQSADALSNIGGPPPAGWQQQQQPSGYQQPPPGQPHQQYQPPSPYQQQSYPPPGQQSYPAQGQYPAVPPAPQPGPWQHQPGQYAPGSQPYYPQEQPPPSPYGPPQGYQQGGPMHIPPPPPGGMQPPYQPHHPQQSGSYAAYRQIVSSSASSEYDALTEQSRPPVSEAPPSITASALAAAERAEAARQAVARHRGSATPQSGEQRSAVPSEPIYAPGSEAAQSTARNDTPISMSAVTPMMRASGDEPDSRSGRQQRSGSGMVYAGEGSRRSLRTSSPVLTNSNPGSPRQGYRDPGTPSDLVRRSSASSLRSPANRRPGTPRGSVSDAPAKRLVVFDNENKRQPARIVVYQPSWSFPALKKKISDVFNLRPMGELYTVSGGMVRDPERDLESGMEVVATKHGGAPFSRRSLPSQMQMVE